MSDDEKRRFYELAQKDAERYQAEVGLWEYELAVLDVVLAFFGISHDFDVLGAFILCGVSDAASQSLLA